MVEPMATPDADAVRAAVSEDQPGLAQLRPLALFDGLNDGQLRQLLAAGQELTVRHR